MRSEELTAMIILHLIPSCFIDRPRKGQGYLRTIFMEKTEILIGNLLVHANPFGKLQKKWAMI